MANSYCKDQCYYCDKEVSPGEAFLLQPVTLTKEEYGRYPRPMKAGTLRIKYHGGATSHRKVFHTGCWEAIDRLINYGSTEPL